jgi:hypothetical protein
MFENNFGAPKPGSSSEKKRSQEEMEDVASKGSEKKTKFAPPKKTAPSKEKYYFNLPGNMTGDIWHLAAAMCLNQEFGSAEQNRQVTLKALIGVVKTSEGEGKAKGKYEIRSPSLIDFLKALNLPVKQVDVPKEKKRPNAAASFTKVSKDNVLIERRLRDTPGSYRVEEVIDQRVSTTILMHHVKAQGKVAVISCLQKRFTESLPLPDKMAMDAKVKQILQAVRAQGPGKKAVLLNRRTGELNKQHNTTDGIEAQIKELASKKNMFVIGIATPKGKPGDIDLFDSAGKSQAKQEFVDKRRTAYFWMQVSKYPKEIHGLIGGRSGSMDIAAFMGVNAFSWDEKKPSDEQVLRLLQTYPLMHIGYVEGEKNEKEAYEKLESLPLTTWIYTGRCYEKPPKKLEEKHIQGLEAAGYRAHYLRDGLA